MAEPIRKDFRKEFLGADVNGQAKAATELSSIEYLTDFLNQAWSLILVIFR